MIYTSYFAKLKQGKGVKISISRFYPKWLKAADIDYQELNLAPSVNLLRAYKAGTLTKKEYEDIYVAETKIEFIENLIAFSKDKDVTLYCYEKSGEFCHRRILARLIEEITGENVKEI